MNNIPFINNAIKKSEKNLSDLFKLIKAHPELPVIPMVDSEIVGDCDYSRWLGSWGSAYIETFLSTRKHGMLYKDDIRDVFEKYFDYEECNIPDDLSPEEEGRMMREYVDKLPWQTAIIVNIDLPNVPEVKINNHGRLEVD